MLVRVTVVLALPLELPPQRSLAHAVLTDGRIVRRIHHIHACRNRSAGYGADGQTGIDPSAKVKCDKPCQQQ